MPTNSMPWIPNKAPPIINRNLYRRIALMNSGSTNISEDIEVIAITIIIIGDTMPALTAASPSMRAPTIERADDAKLGIFKSLSLSISNDIVIIKASMNVEKGTPSLWAAILINNSVGIISWLYVVKAIYTPGVINVIIKVR